MSYIYCNHCLKTGARYEDCFKSEMNDNGNELMKQHVADVHGCSMSGTQRR